MPTQPPSSDALLHALLDASATGIAELCPVQAAEQLTEILDFSYVRLNPVAQRLLGLPEHPTQTLRAQGPQVAAVFAFYQATFLAGTPGYFDLSGTTAAGRAYRVRVAAQRSGPHLLASFTELAAKQGLNLDTSLAPAAGGLPYTCDCDTIERQRQRLARFFQQVPAAIGVLDGPELVFELVNPAYQWLVPGRELLGKPLLKALPELIGQPIAHRLREVYDTGTTLEGRDMPMMVYSAASGQTEERYFDCVYQARHDEQGHIDGVLIFASEVTEKVLARRQAEQALHDLRVSNEQLMRTNVDLDTFIYTASHDLKSPIANIEGLLLLLRKQLPPEARQAGIVPRVLDMMQGAIERFQLTIAQLTDLAKLQHAHTQPAEEVDLPAVVEAVRLDLGPLLTEAHAQLVVQLDSCAIISFAPQHLRSIVYNLLSNAIKYRHPDRPLVVQVRCHRSEAATVFEVQDNGLGLTAAQQSKLFGMFRRLHDHVPGSGVGLYMVKRIIENAGGSIGVRSQAGMGSTFTISLPN